MSKAKLAILERLFVHELTAEHPLQNFRLSKAWRELVDDGMIKCVEYKIGPVTCQGWALSVRGHITYCESCGDSKAPARAPEHHLS